MKKTIRYTLIALPIIFVGWVVFLIWVNNQRSVGRLVIDTKPEQSSLIGDWYVDKSSYPSILLRTGKESIFPKLKLDQNGRFTVEDYPIEDSFSDPKWRLVTGHGFWSLERKQYWVVQLGFSSGFGIPLDIREKSDKLYALTYSVGDPDSNEQWIWRRLNK